MGRAEGYRHGYTWLCRKAGRFGSVDPSSAGPACRVPTSRSCLQGSTPRISTEDWTFTLKDGPPGKMELGRIQRSAADQDDTGHPLRDDLVEVRHVLGGRAHRRFARRAYSSRRPAIRLLILMTATRQSADRRPRWRQGHGGAAVCRQAHPVLSMADRRGCCAASLLLEIRQMGERAAVHPTRRTRLLGVARLPPLRRPVARTALHERLTRPCTGRTRSSRASSACRRA